MRRPEHKSERGCFGCLINLSTVYMLGTAVNHIDQKPKGRGSSNGLARTHARLHKPQESRASGLRAGPDGTQQVRR